MEISKDYEDLFKVLNAYKIRYLVVGGYAVIHYTEPRYTKDIDVWIIPEINKAQTVYEALKAFGAPLVGMKPEDFTDKGMIFQIGVAPVRVDIMMNIPGISFESAWKNRKRIHYGKAPINMIGLQDLIKAKRKAGRSQDVLDLEKLTRRGRR